MPMTVDDIVGLVRRLFEGIIAHNADLEIIRENGTRAITLSVRGHAADAPRILGKGGAHFKAIKFIAAAAGRRIDRQVILAQMMPPITGKGEEFPTYRHNPNWPRQEIQNLIVDVCKATLGGPITVELKERGQLGAFMVSCGQHETRSLISVLSANVTVLFGSIGMTNGCVITVDFKEDRT